MNMYLIRPANTIFALPQPLLERWHFISRGSQSSHNESIWRNDHSLDFYQLNKKLQKWAILRTRVPNKASRSFLNFHHENTAIKQ